MNNCSLLQRRRMTDWRKVLRKWKGDAGQPRAYRMYSLDQVDCKYQGVHGVKHKMRCLQIVSKQQVVCCGAVFFLLQMQKR